MLVISYSILYYDKRFTEYATLNINRFNPSNLNFFSKCKGYLYSVNMLALDTAKLVGQGMSKPSLISVVSLANVQYQQTAERTWYPPQACQFLDVEHHISIPHY